MSEQTNPTTETKPVVQAEIKPDVVLSDKVVTAEVELPQPISTEPIIVPNVMPEMAKIPDKIDVPEGTPEVSVPVITGTEKNELEMANKLLAEIYKIKEFKVKGITEYYNKIQELAVSEANIRKELGKVGLTKLEIERLKALITAYGSEKNIWKEHRYALKMLDQEEGRLWVRIAKIMKEESTNDGRG